MDVQLEDEQVDYLRTLLRQQLGDLRMEISDTDSWEYKRQLKRDEAVLRSILDTLGEAP